MTDVMVKWRDNASPAFYNERTQEVSKKLDFLFFHTPGQFRTRQHEISFTDNLPFAIIAMEEEVELLDN